MCRIKCFISIKCTPVAPLSFLGEGPGVRLSNKAKYISNFNSKLTKFNIINPFFKPPRLSSKNPGGFVEGCGELLKAKGFLFLRLSLSLGLILISAKRNCLSFDIFYNNFTIGVEFHVVGYIAFGDGTFAAAIAVKDDVHR